MKPQSIGPTLLGLTLLLAGGVAAQDAGSQRFGEVVDVELVNVEVWVTDKEGQPVTGLVVDDFEILEDGAGVTITHFAEVLANRPVPYSESALAASSSAAAAPPPGATPPNVEPGHMVIYFDQLHLVPASRKRIIKDLRGFLAAEEVAPERILILSQDRDLSTEVTFGSSWQEVDAALTRIEKTASRGGVLESEKRLLLRDLHKQWERALDLASRGPNPGGENAACQVFQPRAVSQVEFYAAKRRELTAVTLDHLANVASFLTGVPGVKTMLYLSDGLERAPGTDFIQFIKTLCPAKSDTPLFILSDELSREFNRLTRHANANRVTIYAIQTQGLSASRTSGAENDAVELRGTSAFEIALRQSERDGLSILAAETGGRAILSRNRFRGELSEIARQMSGYYSLAYEPPHGGDEGEHRIEVRPKDKELRLRHRSGYRDKRPDTRMTERLQAAVYLGLVDNPLAVRLGSGTVRPRDKKWVVLPLHVFFPAEKIVFLPEDEAPTAHLSVQVSTRNTKNQKGIFEHRVFRVKKPADPTWEILDLVVELEVPEGVHLVAVALRDDATQKTSFVSTTLEIHATATGGEPGS